MTELTEEVFKEKAGQFDVEHICVLSLAHLGISQLQNMTLLVSLVELDVEGNRLVSFDGIQPLTGLRRLHAENNHITDLSHLRGCRQLEQLCIQGNRISSFEDILPLKDLPKLRSLTLRDADGDRTNPLCERVPQYARRVARLLRVPTSLRLLDGDAVVAMDDVDMDPEDTEEVGGSERVDVDVSSRLPKDPWVVEEALQMDFSSVTRSATRAEEVFEDMCKDARRLLTRADLALEDIQPKS